MKLEGIKNDIASIAYDSRKSGPGALFCCLRGAKSDGHKYIEDCYKNGVRAFLVLADFDCPVLADAEFIRVSDTRRAMALYSAEFFGYPARHMTMIGITGTKGKTSVSFMLAGILDAAVIGTTGVYFKNESFPTVNTTPESFELHRLFAELLAKGCSAVVMEVSSQGLKQCRTDGIEFDYGVFLNLSPDHIGPDEHESFEEYLSCKSKLFTQCKKAFACSDSEYWQAVTSPFQGEVRTFSLNNVGSMTPVRQNGRFCVKFDDYTVSMPGEYSVQNALAAISVADDMGVGADTIKRGLESAVVCGRFEPVDVPAPFSVVIDYAHNELSMEKLREAVEQYPRSRVFMVFGAGGNRARERRLSMGRVAGSFCDKCFLTSDNPRDEDVLSIIDDILEGLIPTGGAYEIIPDRAEAIRRALSEANEDDIVLIVGKGHQRYEEIKGVKYHFDDREVVREYFSA